MCVSGGKKCSFFGKFVVLCFLETPVFRFALLLYYLRFLAYFAKFLFTLWQNEKKNKQNKKQRSVMWMDCIYKTNEMLWNQNWKSFDCMSFLRKEFTQFPRHRNIAVQKILKIHYHISQPAQIS